MHPTGEWRQPTFAASQDHGYGIAFLDSYQSHTSLTMLFLPVSYLLILFITPHVALATNTTTANANATLSLLTLTNTTIYNTTSRQLLQNLGRDDATTSGNYQIRLCGAGQPDSKASQLQRLLPLARAHLGRAVHDANTGTSSRHGFPALFKSDAHASAVAGAFADMAAGEPVAVSADRAMRLGKLTASPSFACMEEGDAFTAHLFARCQEPANRPGGGDDHVPFMMTWGGTELIMICPAFFQLPEALSRASCPRVVDNRASPNGEALMRSMYAVVVRMLAHVYVPETLDHGNRYVETVDFIQDAIELNATASLKNVNNYAFYASAIQAGCTDWPVVSQCEAQGTCVWPPPYED